MMSILLVESNPSSKKDDLPSYQIQSNPSSKKDGKAKVIESTITSMIEQPSFLLNPIHPQSKKDG
jgi:F420-0:gamma-glutamyl ligase